jgi:hypothetical protein
VLATAGMGIVFVGWGVTHPPISQGRPPVPPPVTIPARVVVLDPTSGAVIWSSVTLPTHVVLDPSTGKVVSPVTAGPSTSAP